jgi:allophanate hydrolase subunit 1
MTAALAGAWAQILIAAVLGVVAIWKAIKLFTGRNDPKLTCGFNADVFRALSEVAKEQLEALREVSQSIAAIRYDLRAQALEQSHLQKTVDAVHERIDRLTARGA